MGGDDTRRVRASLGGICGGVSALSLRKLVRNAGQAIGQRLLEASPPTVAVPLRDLALRLGAQSLLQMTEVSEVSFEVGKA